MAITLPAEDIIVQVMSLPGLDEHVLEFLRWFAHRSANKQLRGPSSIDSEIAAALEDYGKEDYINPKVCAPWYLLYSNKWAKALAEVSFST